MSGTDGGQNVVTRSIRRSGESISRVLNPIRGDNSPIRRVRAALDPSTSLQPRRTSDTGNDDARDDDADDDGEMSRWRLALFFLTDSICGAILQAISQHTRVTLWRLWHLEHWDRRSRDDFAQQIYPSWYSCFCWPFTTARKIGLLGMYEGLKWHIASNIVSNTVQWGLALYSKFLNIELSEKTRQRIAAGCAVVPQMYLQVRT